MSSSIKLSIFLLLLPFLLLSQNVDSDYLSLKDATVKDSSSNNLFFFCKKSNTKFSSDQGLKWQKGILLTTTNDSFPILARYNVEKDEVELKSENSIFILFKEKNKAIAIGNKVYITALYPEQDQYDYSYFELLSEGAISLLRKDENTFFYKKENKPAKKLKASKKYLTSIFKNHKTEISDYFNTYKPNLKKEQDLIEFFNYMNQNMKLARR